MEYLRKSGQVIGSAVAIVLVFCATSAMAQTITSPSYKIDGNLGGSFGGQTSSTSYKMTAIGGEAIVGNGSSGSYIIDQRQTSTSAKSIQLGVQPSGLVALYPLDEGTGTTASDAGRHQTSGSLNTTATWDASGKLGGAVNMNGAIDASGDGAVLVPDNSNLPSGSAMTVEAWVRQDAWYSNQAIASHWSYFGGNMSGSWALQTGADRNIRIFIADSLGDNGNNYVDTAANTWNTFNTWRHVAMVYDGTQTQANKVKVYIDGQLVGSTAYGTIASSLQNSSGSFSIGSFPGLGRAMSGSIDHVKLFNRVLSADEVAAEYKGQNAGVSTGLTLGAPINGSTTSLADAFVRTNASDYSLAIQQDHDLQSGSNTIPAVSGTISEPLSWTEGVTKGLGFTLTGAPVLNAKWNSGSKYAAIPNTPTSFYSGTGHIDGVVDVVTLRLRLDIDASQPVGEYTNNVIYTGTATP